MRQRRLQRQWFTADQRRKQLAAEGGVGHAPGSPCGGDVQAGGIYRIPCRGPVVPSQHARILRRQALRVRERPDQGQAVFAGHAHGAVGGGDRPDSISRLRQQSRQGGFQAGQVLRVRRRVRDRLPVTAPIGGTGQEGAAVTREQVAVMADDAVRPDGQHPGIDERALPQDRREGQPAGLPPVHGPAGGEHEDGGFVQYLAVSVQCLPGGSVVSRLVYGTAGSKCDVRMREQAVDPLVGMDPTRLGIEQSRETAFGGTDGIRLFPGHGMYQPRRQRP